jgi:hypothetical protein
MALTVSCQNVCVNAVLKFILFIDSPYFYFVLVPLSCRQTYSILERMLK